MQHRCHADAFDLFFGQPHLGCNADGIVRHLKTVQANPVVFQFQHLNQSADNFIVDLGNRNLGGSRC